MTYFSHFFIITPQIERHTMVLFMRTIRNHAKQLGPKKAAFAGVGIFSGISFLLWGSARAKAKLPRTISSEWAAETKEYLKFQGCNPIRNGDNRLPGNRTM